ncbi:Spy/CpxP family protein refolding chaperone [Arcobacter sp.]|uniref:Spy/CpxP family protein refolding chaperone n=1 Tax=unclassified Arcobacter TaxID=2593671 RepID=UPI003AFF954F
MIKLKILALLCSIIFSTNLFADKYEHHEKDKEQKHHIYKNLDYLNLDKNQLAKIKEVLKKYKKESKRFYKFERKKEKELTQLIEKKDFDEITYGKILDEINQKSKEIEVKNLKKIHDILNDEQKEKFSHFLKEWRIE